MAGMDLPAHDHRHDPPRRAAGFSLLRLSAFQRLGVVAIALAALWSGVRWALS
jgi:hypothetical protein